MLPIILTGSGWSWTFWVARVTLHDCETAALTSQKLVHAILFPICLTIFQFESGCRIFIIGSNGKNQIRAYDFELQFSFNKLSAKLSFQLWYPGGKCLKVISLSWSWLKSPSKCFSNKKPSTIINFHHVTRNRTAPLASKTNWCTQVRYTRWPTLEMSRMTAFLRCPPLQSNRPAAVHPRTRKQRRAKRQRHRVLETGTSKLAGLVDDEGLRLHTITRWLLCAFSLLDHWSPQATRTNRQDDWWFFCARSRQRPEVKFLFKFSTYRHQKTLLSMGITKALGQVKPALLWKRKVLFKSNSSS